MSLHASTVEVLTFWQAPDFAQDSLRHAVLAFLDANPLACQRISQAGHITASALVVNHDGNEVLLTLHPRIHRWVQLGGHCEEQDNTIHEAALREAIEESGITELTIDSDLLAVHVHPITCSLGVPTRHLDLQFLARAPQDAQHTISDESLDLKWWPIRELPSTEPALNALVQRAIALLAR